MPIKHVAFGRALCIASVIATAIFADQPQVAQRVVLRQESDGQLSFQFAKGSSVRLTIDINGETAMEVAIENSWRDIASDDGAKQLKKFLEGRTKGRLERLTRSPRFTAEQKSKLVQAAGLQVARDCRAIQQLELRFTETKRESPFKNGNIDREAMRQVADECSATLYKVDEILLRSIDHKESLFRKVLKNTSSE